MAASAVFIDTNVLVYANLVQSPYHDNAANRLVDLENSHVELRISRQVLRENVVVMTRPDATDPAIPVRAVLDDARSFGERFRVADETATTTTRLLALLQTVPTRGRQVHDANIVATMLENGLTTLLTNNPGHFRRFEPLIAIQALTT